METILDNIEHVLTAVALAIASVAAWFARRAGTAGHRQTFDAVVRDACDYAEAHPSPGVTRERTALDAARLGDVRADGKRDFSDAVLVVAIRAEFARRDRRNQPSVSP